MRLLNQEEKPQTSLTARADRKNDDKTAFSSILSHKQMKNSDVNAEYRSKSPWCPGGP
jgi:hypothetical protein